MKLFDGFDHAYLEHLRSGAPETEAHFIRYFSELILVKLRRQLPSRAIIDDVNQETFLRVFRALRTLGGIREPERPGPLSTPYATTSSGNSAVRSSATPLPLPTRSRMSATPHSMPRVGS